MIRTREQDYAGKIFDQIKDEVKDKNFQDDYKNAAKNLAFLIRSAGLVQALYFTQTRNDGSELLVRHLAVVVESPNAVLTEVQAKRCSEVFLENVRTKPISEYMFLTEKCLLALKWYKRFVDVLVKDKDQRNSANREVDKNDNISG